MVITSTNVPICAPMPRPKNAAAAAATAPALMKAQPKWGSVTSMTAATSATASHESDPTSAAHWENHSDRTRRIIGL